MKKRSGSIIGFVTGMEGFLLLFKVIVLDHTPPSDELAPGMVLILSVFSGILFALIGRRVQRYAESRSKNTA